MKHKWILLMFSGLILVSIISCSPAISSPPSSTGADPLPDTPVGKPTAMSSSATGAIVPLPSETSIRQWIAVPITQSQPGGVQEQPVLSNTPISIPLEPASQQIVIQAKEDLARRLGVPPDSITADAVIGQEFSTDAFYCRTSKDRISKDESPQMIPGHSILLHALAHRYEYHASGQTVIFCRPLP